jgi:hypothetical protein
MLPNDIADVIARALDRMDRMMWELEDYGDRDMEGEQANGICLAATILREEANIKEGGYRAPE